jgi:hypothetical protein
VTYPRPAFSHIVSQSTHSILANQHAPCHTVANQDDNLTLTEAMNGSDAAGFFKAMAYKWKSLQLSIESPG